MRSYVVGEIKTHHELRQLMQDIKFDLKAIVYELKEKLRSTLVRILDR